MINNLTVEPSGAPASSPEIKSSLPAPPGTGLRPAPGKNRRLIVIIFALLIFSGIAGGLVFAYNKGILFFGKKKQNFVELFSGLSAKLGEMNSATYDNTLSLRFEPRDADAMPFESEEVDLSQTPLGRDAVRFRALGVIVRALGIIELASGSSDKITSRFPKTLDEILKHPKISNYYNPYDYNVLKTHLRDPLTSQPYDYKVSPDQKNYSLKITFETDEAIQMLSNETRPDKPFIEGKTATFHATKNLYERYFGVILEGRVAQERERRFSIVENLDPLLDYLSPTDYLDFRFQGTAQNQSEKAIDGRFQLSADAQFFILLGSIDVEFIKKDQIFFGRINKFASENDEYNNIKDKWVKILPEDRLEYFGDLSFFKAGKEEDEARIVERVQIFLKIANEEGVIVFSEQPTEETLGGKAAYRYHLSVVKEKIPKFYERFSKEFEARFGADAGIKFETSTLEYFQSQEYEEVYNYLKKNAAFDLWIDSETGFPLRISYALRLVPGPKATKFKDKQFSIKAVISLSDINKAITVEEPKEFISFDEAQALVSGLTVEEVKFEKQIKAVEAVRSALDDFKDLTGSFPNTLDALLKTRGEVRKEIGSRTPPAREFDTYLNDVPFLESLPIDAFTGQPMLYIGKAGDYELKYQIKIPAQALKIQPGGKIKLVTGVPLFLTSPFLHLSFNLPVISFLYAEGLNTATKTPVSKEAKELASQDTDKDGISDSLETYLGTNKNKWDTDGDGHSDGEELRNGYNPLRPGRLTGMRESAADIKPLPSTSSADNVQYYDDQRTADLREMQNVLELYYNEKNHYPPVSGWSALSKEIISAGIGITSIPQDPVNSAPFLYDYKPGDCGPSGKECQIYILKAVLDPLNPALKNDTDFPTAKSGIKIDCADPAYCIAI